MAVRLQMWVVLPLLAACACVRARPAEEAADLADADPTRYARNAKGEEGQAIKPAVIIPMAPLILEAANKGERYANRYQTPMNILNENNLSSELQRQQRSMAVNVQNRDSLENMKENPILAYLLKKDEGKENKTRGQPVVRRKVTHQQTLYGPIQNLRTFPNPLNPQQGEGSVQNVGQFFSPESSFSQPGSPANDYSSPSQAAAEIPVTSANSQEKSPTLSGINHVPKDNSQQSGVHVHTTMNIFPVIPSASQQGIPKFGPISENIGNDVGKQGLQSRISWPWSGYFPIVIQDPATAIYSAFTSMVEYGPEADVCGDNYGEDEKKKNRKQQRRRGRMMEEEEEEEKRSDDAETMDVGDVVTQFVLRKGGVAIAGPGGTAAAGDGGTAVVGPGGIVYARPNGLAVVGPGGKVVSLPAGVSEPRSVGLPLPQGAKIVATGPIVYYHHA